MLRESYTQGERVILDKEFRNFSIVEVVSQTSGRLFTRVKSLETGTEWEVMTNRLEKI